MKQLKTFLLGSITLLGLLGFSSKASAEEIEHTVTSKDTLTGISLKYFGNIDYVDYIVEMNQIDNPNLIYDGTTLVFDTEVNESSINTNEATVATESNETSNENEYSGKTIMMESTAYSSDPADTLGGGTVTATGQNLLENPMAVAVDPSVIPLGTRLYVEGYGEAIASDTGGAIKGNIVDVHFSTYEECIAWGRRMVQVTILD